MGLLLLAGSPGHYTGESAQNSRCNSAGLLIPAPHPRDALDALYKHLARLQADIACKANSMLLDTKCMDTRRKLMVPAEKFVPQVDTFTRTTNRTLSPLKRCQLELA